jgi:4-hydroxy 2-oxovalerate aldolase
MNNLEKFQILDCTLRDGGYYTNWDFDNKLIETYFDSFNNLPVDYLEIGYRSNPMNQYLGEYFYCPNYVLEQSKDLSSKKLAIILNEKDVRAEHIPNLLQPCVGYIDMVRIAIAPVNFKRALILAEAVKKLGFEVGFNVMYMSTWAEERDFLNEIKNVNGITDYFYMVDSFGGVYPDEVKKTYDLVKSKSDVKIGFHGHNNLELGLINTLTAIGCGADIVDATVTGMGRGAGNLKTELLLTSLNSKNGMEVDFNELSRITAIFSEMQKQYAWGTNLPYMVSGGNSLPQKEVMEWVSKRYYSFNSIIRALHNQKQGVKDNQKFPHLNSKKSFKKAIIIGGGPSATNHLNGILKYIEKNQKDVCLIHASSRNAKYFKNLDVDQYFCLIGSEGQRLEKTIKNLGDFSAICILPPFPRKMGTYVPDSIMDSTFELTKYTSEDVPAESPTVLAMELAIVLGADEFYTIGYDGYDNESIGQKEQELFLENDEIFAEYLQKEFALKSLTPTKYRSLSITSIYSHFV